MTAKDTKSKPTNSKTAKIIDFFPDSTYYELREGFTSERDKSWGFPDIVEIDKKKFAVGHHRDGRKRVYFSMQDLLSAYRIARDSLIFIPEVPFDRLKKIYDSKVDKEEAVKDSIKKDEAPKTEVKDTPKDTPKLESKSVQMNLL